MCPPPDFGDVLDGVPAAAAHEAGRLHRQDKARAREEPSRGEGPEAALPRLGRRLHRRHHLLVQEDPHGPQRRLVRAREARPRGARHAQKSLTPRGAG